MYQVHPDFWLALVFSAVVGGPLLVGGAVQVLRQKVVRTEGRSVGPLRLLCLGAGLCLPVFA